MGLKDEATKGQKKSHRGMVINVHDTRKGKGSQGNNTTGVCWRKPNPVQIRREHAGYTKKTVQNGRRRKG